MGNRVANIPDLPTSELLTDLEGIVGAVVRTGAGDARVPAAILIGCGQPILTLNDAVIGTDGQSRALLWAITRIRAGAAGFYFMRVG